MKKPTTPLPEEPLLPLDLWAPGTEVLRRAPAALRPWLTEPGLLTERIAAAAGAAATIEVLEQRVGWLSREQQDLLRAPADSCFVREVALVAAGRRWVYAQTLVPDCTLEEHGWLAELGATSLGTTLAGLAALERGAFEFGWLPASHPLAARALAAAGAAAGVRPESLWARRSWVGLRGRRLLVQEVFLPGIAP